MKFFPIFVIPSTLALVAAAGASPEFVVNNQEVKIQQEGLAASAALNTEKKSEGVMQLFSDFEASDEDSNHKRILQATGEQPESTKEVSAAVLVRYAQVHRFERAIKVIGDQISDLETLLKTKPNHQGLSVDLQDLRNSHKELKESSQALNIFHPDEDEKTEVSHQLKTMGTELDEATPKNILHRFAGIKLAWGIFKLETKNVLKHFAEETLAAAAAATEAREGVARTSPDAPQVRLLKGFMQ